MWFLAAALNAIVHAYDGGSLTGTILFAGDGECPAFIYNFKTNKKCQCFLVLSIHFVAKMLTDGAFCVILGAISGGMEFNTGGVVGGVLL